MTLLRAPAAALTLLCASASGGNPLVPHVGCVSLMLSLIVWLRLAGFSPNILCCRCCSLLLPPPMRSPLTAPLLQYRMADTNVHFFNGTFMIFATHDFSVNNTGFLMKDCACWMMVAMMIFMSA